METLSQIFHSLEIKPHATQHQNHSQLVVSMFRFGEGGVLKPLLLHYISKILILLEDPESSALRAGKLSNSIIEMALDARYSMEDYQAVFSRLLIRTFDALMKVIINLYILKDDQNIRAYHLSVTSNYSISVLTCLRTFCLTVKLDSRNSFRILDEVYITV